MLRNVLIVDCETTGLDREKDRVIEIGYVLWSVEHRTMLEVYSGLLYAPENPAEHINSIPAAALANGDAEPWLRTGRAAATADAFVAHQADFDRAFAAQHIAAFDSGAAKPWICTREDFKWPKAGAGASLIATALAHGCAVVAAHRAVNDCLLLARLLESIPDVTERLDAALEHALLPKVRLVSLAPFEEKDGGKDNGVKGDPKRRGWGRVMAAEDSKTLPFRTRAEPSERDPRP